MQSIYLTIVLAPLAAAVIAGLVRQDHRQGRRAQRHHRWGSGSSCVLSFYVLYQSLFEGSSSFNGAVYTWLVSDGLTMNVGFLIDRLSAMMMAVVTFVSLMVHIYTIGYMHDDDGYQRFFSYISLVHVFDADAGDVEQFHAVVLRLGSGGRGVVPADRLLVHAPTAIFANLKAFLVNRVGDFGFVLGIAAVLRYTGSLDYATVFAHADQIAAAQIHISEHSRLARDHRHLHPVCSSAPWASPRRCRCTSGCPIPWKARRRFRR